MNFKDSLRFFLKELQMFDCSLFGTDHFWTVIYPDRQGKWHAMHITKYRQTFYISMVGRAEERLEVGSRNTIKQLDFFNNHSHAYSESDLARLWAPRIVDMRIWFRKVTKDWVRANRLAVQRYPLNCRFGKVPNALVQSLVPNIFRLDKELGMRKTRKMVRLVEEGFFNTDENVILPTMTAADYFSYCKIAYIAGRRKDDTVDPLLSGREMYKRYADGRHEGLLDIDENSGKEFADWLDGTHPKKSSGGHPWEIKRGGNTTHINLQVTRPSIYRKEGFKVELHGPTINRMVETINMFLAIHEATRPISIADPEGVRKRLLAQDNIGIVPEYDTLHRANQHFRDDEAVYDVMYLRDLGRKKRSILPFITWEPLPLFKPRDIY